VDDLAIMCLGEPRVNGAPKRLAHGLAHQLHHRDDFGGELPELGGRDLLRSVREMAWCLW
jgi:hypothetical protein